MTKYKNYYIDGVYFHNKAEIDAHIRQKAIDTYIMYVKMFAEKVSMELNVIMCEHADKLVKQFGLTYSEIEAIEINTLKAL